MTSRTFEKDKPSRPLNAYFRFRAKRIAEMGKDEKNRGQKIKLEWDDLSVKEKDKLEQEVKKDMDAYNIELEKWRNKHGIKERSKSKKPAERSEPKKPRERSA